MSTKAELLKANRKKCLDCCGGSTKNVRLCTATDCALWPFRMGKDPNPAIRGFKKKVAVCTDNFSDEENWIKQKVLEGTS